MEHTDETDTFRSILLLLENNLLQPFVPLDQSALFIGTRARTNGS